MFGCFVPFSSRPLFDLGCDDWKCRPTDCVTSCGEKVTNDAALFFLFFFLKKKRKKTYRTPLSETTKERCLKSESGLGIQLVLLVLPDDPDRFFVWYF